MKYGAMYTKEDFDRNKHEIVIDNLPKKCCYTCFKCVPEATQGAWTGTCCGSLSTSDWDAFVSLDDCCGEYELVEEDKS